MIECAQGTFYTCVAATASVMQYNFYIDSGADGSETDVSFWLRITTGWGEQKIRTTCRSKKWVDVLRPSVFSFNQIGCFCV